MVRTDNTSRIKQRVADEVRGEEARAAELSGRSTESGPHDGTNGESPKNIQTAKEGEEGEDEKRSAAALEEGKYEMVYEDVHGRRNAPRQTSEKRRGGNRRRHCPLIPE
ncbi:hypothetical protein PI124_g19773 [Phytophthora idaei]|nr:hypothetical protein PI124_g19773 [Phytophthora idaei]